MFGQTKWKTSPPTQAQPQVAQVASPPAGYAPTAQPVAANAVPDGATAAAPPQDAMAADLMWLVGSAIDQWAARYGLQNMPRRIVFGQALSLMNAYGELLPDEAAPAEPAQGRW